MSAMISHTRRNIPPEARVSHCARTDSNRRPLGSKTGGLLCAKAYDLSTLRAFERGKSSSVRMRNAGVLAGCAQNFPQLSRRFS
jgi:hypothetical protein